MKGSSFNRVDASALVILMSALALATVVATGACDYHVVIGWHDWGQGRAGSGGAAGLGGGSAGSGGTTGLAGGSAGSGGATGFAGGSAGSGGGGGSGGVAGAIALFLPPVAYPIGRRVGHIALGDLNGDRRPDIAVVSYPPVRPDGGGSEPGPTSVNVFLSAGDSAYAPAQTYTPGEHQFVLAVGDIDGDGQGDLVVTNNPGVSLLLNGGGGALRPPIALDAGHYPVGLALADLNDDGRTDIVVANASVDNRGELDLLMNLGGGMFARGLQEMRHGNNYAMALGDLDSSGKPDIVVVNNGLDVLLNTGDGTFAPRVNYAPRLNSSDTGVAIGDLDGDGKPDLAFTSYAATDRTTVRLNLGDGIFATPADYLYDRGSIDDIAINDVNGDGLPDLVTNWSYSALAVLLNQGAGTFSAAIRVDVSVNYFALGDVNRDGRVDIVATTDTGIAILFGRR